MIAQSLLAVGIVIAAAAWLAGRQLRRGTSVASRCSGCPAMSQRTGGSCPSCQGTSR